MASDDRPADERINEEFEAAPTRRAKLDVLMKYMSEDMAHDALGSMLGEHDGDIIDLADDRNRDRRTRKDLDKPM